MMKLAEVRRYALSMPAAHEEPHFNYSSFRVNGKIFATVPPGDEILNIFVAEEQRERALAVDPEFIEKLPWGKQIVGLRISLANAKPKVVKQLLFQAWARKAPKNLLT
jgi:hypothetical protein